MLSTDDPTTRVWLSHLSSLCETSVTGELVKAFDCQIGAEVAAYCHANSAAYSALVKHSESDSACEVDKGAINWLTMNLVMHTPPTSTWGTSSHAIATETHTYSCDIGRGNERGNRFICETRGSESTGSSSTALELKSCSMPPAGAYTCETKIITDCKLPSNELEKFSVRFAACVGTVGEVTPAITALEHQHLRSAHTDNARYYHAVKNGLIVGVPDPIDPARFERLNGPNRCTCCPFGVMKRRECKERQRQKKLSPAKLMSSTQLVMWQRVVTDVKVYSHKAFDKTHLVAGHMSVHGKYLIVTPLKSEASHTAQNSLARFLGVRLGYIYPRFRVSFWVRSQLETYLFFFSFWSRAQWS